MLIAERSQQRRADKRAVPAAPKTEAERRGDAVRAYCRPGRGRPHPHQPGLHSECSREPIIPFIEGDGIGVDVTPPWQRVVDAAVPRPMAARRSVDGGVRGREGEPALRQLVPG